MDAKEFNRLLKLHKYDKAAANELYLYCLNRIMIRLRFRYGSSDMESLAYSILEKFIKYAPDHISAPVSYLNICTDNYLSTLKSYRDREVPLEADYGYEQSFEELEKFDTFRQIEEVLGKEDAYIFYSHYMEGVPEKEIAEKVHLSYENVRQKISRGKKLLAKVFSKRRHK